MTLMVRMREKGQMTLPLEVRRQLGLRQGDLLEASVKDSKVVLELVARQEPTVVSVIYNLDKLVGIVSLGGDAVEDAARHAE